jgi:hypothetical protein
MKYPVILCGDHAEFEMNYKGKPEDRPDWPVPSFDARDWARAFCKQYPAIDEHVMLGWFANALMRGYDEGVGQALRQVGSTQETHYIKGE